MTLLLGALCALLILVLGLSFWASHYDDEIWAQTGHRTDEDEDVL